MRHAYSMEITSVLEDFFVSKETYKALIEAVTTQRASELGSTDNATAFMSVVNELILQPYDLTVDEIDAGVTDGNGDGQVDAMYVLANGAVLTGEEEDELPDKGPLEIELVIIQSKYSDGFQENTLKLIRNTANDLIDLKKAYAGYLQNYSEKLQDTFALARKALVVSAGRTGKVRVRVFYATKASTANIHSTVLTTAAVLKSELSALAALYPAEPATFRNDIVFHVLAYISARQFHSLSHASTGWAYKVLDEGEADAAIAAVVALFKAAGATDRVAKSPEFQKDILAAAKLDAAESASAG